MSDSSANGTLIEALADYACAIRLGDVPEQVRTQTGLCILDTIGCVVSGELGGDWTPILDVERMRSDRAEARVIGQNLRLSIEAAARVNAYLGDIFELNDLIGGHASIGVVIALVALAEARGLSGADLMTAVLVGNEVTARVYAGYYPAIKPYTDVAMCPVSFPSALGVAAGAARLLGLDEVSTAHAMAIAGGLASWCPSEVIYGGGGTFKPMLHGSCPAEDGLRAAFYAQAGMTGPLKLLESEIGYFSTAATRSFPESVRDTTTWYVGMPRRKRHACCGYIHSTLDVLGQLRQSGVALTKASAIRIEVPPYILPGVVKHEPPTAPNVARFHLQYCASLVICGADVIKPQHSLELEKNLSRGDVVEAMRRITIVPNAALTHYHQCNVVLSDANGAELARAEGRGPRGSPQNPMTDSEVIAKFRELTAHRLSYAAADDYLARIERLERATECSWLTGAFDGPRQ
jgi:2-methylcitrate dehydratase PrpD